MQLDFSNVRLEPFKHQREDTAFIVQHPFVFNTSEMRTGKTKIIIDAAHFLFQMGAINRVVIVAPAPVRDVWFDPDFGEIEKHRWLTVNNHVTEYHAILRKWTRGPDTRPFTHPDWFGIKWIVTNYDFIRSSLRLEKLLPYVDAKTMLVLDESSAVKHHNSKQTESCMMLRYYYRRQIRKGKLHLICTWQPRAGRIIELNGTPFDTPIDLFSQGNILSPTILQCRYVSQFKARYAQMNNNGFHATDKRGRKFATEIEKWVNLDDLQQRFAPVTIRRLQKDCLDLPPKLDPVTLTVTLSAKTWSYYKAMRDELVIALENGTVTMAQHAITKVMRLAQITSGFVGGIESVLEDDDDLATATADLPPWIEQPMEHVKRVRPELVEPVKEIGREKLDVLLWFYGERLKANADFKLVSWCRFKPEMERMVREVAANFGHVTVKAIAGGQKRAERLEALRLLHPDTAPEGPVFVGGTYGTGSKGLNFTAAHTSINCSYDYSLEKFLQSGDRVYGPGQKHPVAYYDMVAVGPAGQKTIDHVIVKARRAKESVANFTISAWVKALKED